jgi:putative ABC transport system permease protein
MNKIFESAMIALDAIWSSKLRSLMTVLGNIVAVTSIIAVVSLIQGLNASVKEAILNQAGADSFNVQQFPITRSDEEFEKVRGNPRITMTTLRAVRRYSELVSAVMLDSERRRPHHLQRQVDRPDRITGVTGDTSTSRATTPSAAG